MIPYNSSKFLIYFRLLPFNLICRPYFSFLLKQADASDENGVPSQVTVKSIDQGKRSAEGSPENAPNFDSMTSASRVVKVLGKLSFLDGRREERYANTPPPR